MKHQWHESIIVLCIAVAGCTKTSTHGELDSFPLLTTTQLDPTTTLFASRTMVPKPTVTSTTTTTAISQPTRTNAFTTITSTTTAKSTSIWTSTSFASPTGTPLKTPTMSVTATLTMTPVVPKADPTVLLLPPPDVMLDQHLVFGRPVGHGGNNWPTSFYRYGMTWGGRLIPHHGLDIANDLGVPVLSVGAGTVYHAGNDLEIIFAFKHDFYGNLVVLRMSETWQDNTLYALYGHLDTITVLAGQEVSEGELLGTIGGTGAAYAPHLHFEIRVDDPRSYWAVRNPVLWYKALPEHGVMAGRVLDRRGSFIPGHPVTLTCRDGMKRQLDTYWDQGTPPDDVMFENFAISDLPSGHCSVETSIDGRILQDSVEIVDGQISFLVLRIPDK